MALVDLETTGVRPETDAMTEIAILRVENGRETGRWQSLLNPGRAIPSLIVRLIGISDAMVADAPPFAAVADTVAGQLADCVFVAHNARFDHAFLRHAFLALGRPFDPPVLCTLRLARKLYPDHARHGLDALIARHGLACAMRHRAMGDVDALWQFVRLVARAFPAETLAAAFGKAMKRKAARGAWPQRPRVPPSAAAPDERHPLDVAQQFVGNRAGVPRDALDGDPPAP
jgi:DNA polymerase-3 subunit epsilon